MICVLQREEQQQSDVAENHHITLCVSIVMSKIFLYLFSQFLVSERRVAWLLHKNSMDIKKIACVLNTQHTKTYTKTSKPD